MEEAIEGFAFRIPPHIQGDRADKVLAACFPDRSRNQIQKALDAGCILREEVAVKRRDALEGGDCVFIAWPIVPDTKLRGVEIPLDILYEDPDLLVVNKAPGMIVHPGSGTGEDTLVHALLHHTGGSITGVGSVERPGIVHRLDKETSGVLVAAKSPRAYQGLIRQFSGRETRKDYLAWVRGSLSGNSGTIEEPIARHPVVRVKMSVSPRGREAYTEWEVIGRCGDRATLLHCRIHTGRTHQIRVHLSHLGHPLLGDFLYGYKERGSPPDSPPRTLLHAWKLGFRHPGTQDPMDFVAPLPDDFLTMTQGLLGRDNLPKILG